MSRLDRIARVAPIRRASIRWFSRWGLARDARGRVHFPYVTRRRHHRFLILLYHRVTDAEAPFFSGEKPAAFRLQMEQLLEHGTPLHLSELVTRAQNGDVPPGAWSVTFDDGYRDNFDCAYPILRSLGIPATVFLVSGSIEDRRPIWHDRVFEAFAHARIAELRIGERVMKMALGEARRAALEAFLRAARAHSPAERDVLIEDLLRQCGSRPENHLAERLLTWDQIRSMMGGGMDFGAHTVTHPILSRMPLRDAIAEIETSKAQIESRLKVPVTLFAYPNGSRGDFTSEVKAAVQAAGYTAAVSTVWGANSRDSDPFELRRVGMWGSDPQRASLRLAWYRFRE